LNWLDTLDPDHPDVVGRAGTLADMLVVRSGFESEPHWNDTARDLLRGFLVHVAGSPAERRTMAELRAMLTAPEDQFAEILADMLATPECGGQRLVQRTAAAHLGRPERERGSVRSTAQRHTGWLDDPRLCAALARSDFSLHDLKRRPMTVYLAIPPDRLRASLGFVRGFIGMALDAMTAVPGRPAYRVVFFLDEFGQLGRLDSLVDGLTLMRGAPSSGSLSRTSRSSKPSIRAGRVFSPIQANNISGPPITTPHVISVTCLATTRSRSRPPTARATPAGRSNPGPRPRATASTATGDRS
jgi:type IV secretion system protein VirD4